MLTICFWADCSDAAAQDNLPIHEDRVRGVYVKGLREVYVASTKETMDVMDTGARNRVVSSTSASCFICVVS